MQIKDNAFLIPGGASKGGIVAMALPVARELARLGIRVMTIAPGIFDTPMLQGMGEEIRASLGAQCHFRRAWAGPRNTRGSPRLSSRIRC